MITGCRSNDNRPSEQDNDEIDKPLNDRRDLRESFDKVRRLKSEKERLGAIAKIVD